MTEKLFRRMIVIDRSGDESLTPLVDKLAVRHWVAEKIGAEHAVPVLWTGTSPSDIPFDELPLPSVLKANHNSGAVAVISEGVDRDLV
ncbi:MAG TPA: ATP-grasp fold amidoligase family protein, partial [Gemmatimonadota bacterium]|nr:ATP-grasp fold amidoligase family protein [Gemmatimonadota bacterium]